MKKQETEYRINKAINSFSDIARAEPGPFFSTRVLARLQKRDRTLWGKTSGFLAKPAVAFVVICLVISLNSLVILQTETVSNDIMEQNSIVSSDDSELDIIALYDEENNNTEP